jgi:DeoR family transcriptional regulator, suf operon transcriptional repressor
MSVAPPSSTKQDILHYLLKQGTATAQALAQALDVTPQAIRRHLKDLEAEALIVHEAIAGGQGRPNHAYALSTQGRDRFPARYDEFAMSLLDTLTETVGAEQVGTILRKQWERKALEYRENLGEESLRDRLQKLVELRRREGYMAEFHRVAPEADQAEMSPELPLEGPQNLAEQFVLTEYHCAISHIAESFPGICGHELEMFAVALADCTVERTHWLVNGEHRCGYLIQAKSA